MGVFLAITYDLRWAGSFEANEKQKKSCKLYICQFREYDLARGNI